MTTLIRHHVQDAAGTNGQAHTVGLQTKTIVKYKLRDTWAATLRFTVNARNDATGASAGFEVKCAASAAGGVVTIDGTAAPVTFGNAAMAAVSLTVDGTTNPGYVSLVTPGLAGSNIAWVADVDIWGNK